MAISSPLPVGKSLAPAGCSPGVRHLPVTFLKLPKQATFSALPLSMLAFAVSSTGRRVARHAAEKESQIKDSKSLDSKRKSPEKGEAWKTQETRASQKRLEFKPCEQVGATAPLGFWDPLGFSKNGDEEGFRSLRAKELKHGRVAMLAAFGAVVQHFWRLPNFEKVPSGLAAVYTFPGSLGLILLLCFVAFVEFEIYTYNPFRFFATLGSATKLDPQGLDQYDWDSKEKELNNGRMAMISIAGIVAAELVTGKDGIQQLGQA